MPGSTADGMDVLRVRDAATPAVKRAREGRGPSLVVCNTYRFLGHGGNPDTRSYRTKEEETAWKERCPLNSFEAKLMSAGLLDNAEIARMRAAVLREVEECVRFAEQSPFPSVSQLEEGIYA